MKDAPAAPGKKVRDALDPTARSHLRSVVGYTLEDYTIHYMREDVESQYDNTEIETAIDELRYESLNRHHINSVFSTVHGEQRCRVTIFENAIELNFIVDDGRGVEVAFDLEWGADQLTVINQIQSVLD